MNRKFSARSGHREVAELSVDVSTRQDLRSHCDAVANQPHHGSSSLPREAWGGGHVVSGANEVSGGGASASAGFSHLRALPHPALRATLPTSGREKKERAAARASLD